MFPPAFFPSEVSDDDIIATLFLNRNILEPFDKRWLVSDIQLRCAPGEVSRGEIFSWSI
jgi:hypothetical protein